MMTTYQYFSGKSLILKEVSIRMSKKGDEQENSNSKRVVYYIALTASDRFGKPRNEYFTFDIASKMDLADTEVHVLDCHDLKEMYRKRHGDRAAEDANVYDLVEDLIDSNDREEGGFYFVDECPFLQDGGKALCNFFILLSYFEIFLPKIIFLSIIIFIFLISDYYDKSSIENAQNFVKRCQEKVKEDNKIWIAFQVNAIHDSCRADSGFDQAFKVMKNTLLSEGVFIRSLTSNMRNTTEVAEVTRKAQFGLARTALKLTKNIEALPVQSNVSSTRPWAIPYLKTNRKQHFIKVMKMALKKIKQDGEVLVVMFDPREIEMNQIKKCLLRNEVPEETIILHPEKAKDEGTEHLEAFLKNPKGIYLVPQDCFTGCEAHHLLFILSERNDIRDPMAIRCHISWAVSNLIVIHELVINERLQNNYFLPSMDVEKSFLACCEETKKYAFKCQNHSSDSNSSGGKSFVCKPCIIYCHQNWEERTIESIYDRREKCSCASTTNCLLNETRASKTCCFLL